MYVNDGSVDLRPVSARDLGDDAVIVRDRACRTELQPIDRAVSELATLVDGGLLGIHQVDAIDAGSRGSFV